MLIRKIGVAFLLLALLNRVDAIVGGRQSKAGDWPWIAALGYVVEGRGFRFFCGGSLISNKHILTAGICVLNYANSMLFIARLGDVDLNDDVKDGATPIDIPINNVLRHPNFGINPIRYDVAILTLKQIVQFTKIIQPIPLPTSTAIKPSVGFVMGWGQNGTDGRRAETLIDAQVDIVDMNACQTYAREVGATIDDKIICAGGSGKGACQDDSGIPLVVRNETGYYVAGVTSYRRHCRESGYPGAYAKVVSYLDWIKDSIK